MYCVACQRPKMHFESKKKADNFIKFNAAEMISEGLKAPVRSYYCQLCGAWHVTSNPSMAAGERLDRRDNEIARRIDQEALRDEEIDNILNELENKILEFYTHLRLWNFRKAKTVLKEIESKTPLNVRKKSQIKRVDDFRIKMHTAQQSQYISAKLHTLTENEQNELIESAENQNTKDCIKAEMKAILSYRLVQEVFNQKNNLIACDDGPITSEIFSKCRHYISLATRGSKQASAVLNEHLNEIIQRRKKRIENEKLKRLLCRDETAAIWMRSIHGEDKTCCGHIPLECIG